MGIVSRSQGGGSGSGTLLFDSGPLGANAPSIDTGAGGIAATQNILEVVMLGRTDDAAAAPTVTVTVNNDTGANYDFQAVEGANVTASARTGVAQTGWSIRLHGANGSAGYPGTFTIIIPNYALTTFNKVGSVVNAVPDATAGNQVAASLSVGWRSTVAVSRLKVAAAANLLAGSRLLIFGR